MKIPTPVYRIPFTDLQTLFTKAEDESMRLQPNIGHGCVHVFPVECGLLATLWDYSFDQDIEMYCCEKTGNEEIYFTISFFLDKEGLQFFNNGTLFQKNICCDTLFITSSSHLRMYVPASTHVVCLNISFTKQWLYHYYFACNQAYNSLKDQLFSSAAISLLEYMDTFEKKLVQEFTQTIASKSHSAFYIKSIVLKITSNFLNKLKDKTIFCNTNNKMNALLTEAERQLCNNVKGIMPSFKALAFEYGCSEVSLKRHFKQQFGVNMSTYFIHKKMAYAQQLMQNENMHMSDAAHQLGYTNICHFAAIYKKYLGALSPAENKKATLSVR